MKVYTFTKEETSEFPPKGTSPKQLLPHWVSRQLLGQRVVAVVFSATGRAANCTASGHRALQELQLS